MEQSVLVVVGQLWVSMMYLWMQFLGSVCHFTNYLSYLLPGLIIINKCLLSPNMINDLHWDEDDS
jgi:hypothetical protein